MNLQELFEAKKDNLQTLYCKRKLTNAKEVLKWAEEQGFTNCLDPDDMHVTIAYSKTPIDMSEMTDSFDTVTCSGGKREIHLFGEDKNAVVLTFECKELHDRWKEFIDDFGASWDHDGYRPHVSISYSGLPDGMKLDDVVPFKGALVFGPEHMEVVNPKWAAKIKEKKNIK